MGHLETSRSNLEISQIWISVGVAYTRNVLNRERIPVLWVRSMISRLWKMRGIIDGSESNGEIEAVLPRFV